MTNNAISVTLVLSEGKVKKVNYLDEENVLAIITEGNPVKLIDSKFNVIYESGISKQDMMIDLNDVAQKHGFAGMDPKSIPKVIVNKKSVEIDFLGTHEAVVNVC